MKKCVAFLFSVFFVFNCFAQVKFQKTYKIFGESGGGLTVPTTDGTGYYFGISTIDATITQYDFCLVKTNLYGDTLWTKIYGGGGDNGFSKLYEDTNGNLSMIGSCYGFGSGSLDGYVVKINSVGDTLWTKAIGNSLYNATMNSLKLSNGNFMLLTFTDSTGLGLNDVGLIKIDSVGNILWNKFYEGGTGDNGAMSGIIELADGGFIMSGSTNSYGVGDYDAYAIRTDSLGNISWAKTYGGSLFETGISSIKCSDGVLIAGGTRSFGQGGSDVYLVKLDFNGNLLWAKTYGTALDEFTSKIKQTSDNGFVIGGFYGVVTGDRGEMLMKIDSSGNFQWAKSYGSSMCNDDLSNVTITNDGGFIMSGSSCSFGGFIYNAYIIKTDSLGNSGCNEQSRTFIEMDITSLLTVTNPVPNVYTDPSIVAKNTQTTIYNAALTINTLCFTTDVEETERLENDAKIYPNPNNGSFNFEYKLKPNEKGTVNISDISGKLVESYILENNKNNLQITANGLNSGVYLYQIIINGNVVIADKLVIIK